MTGGGGMGGGVGVGGGYEAAAGKQFAAPSDQVELPPLHFIFRLLHFIFLLLHFISLSHISFTSSYFGEALMRSYMYTSDCTLHIHFILNERHIHFIFAE